MNGFFCHAINCVRIEIEIEMTISIQNVGVYNCIRIYEMIVFHSRKNKVLVLLLVKMTNTIFKMFPYWYVKITVFFIILGYNYQRKYTLSDIRVTQFLDYSRLKIIRIMRCIQVLKTTILIQMCILIQICLYYQSMNC